jgi:sigma-B regulation protein RsbU (phosphoserine phosphatase)
MDLGPGYLLVVDDNEMNRDMLSRRLMKKGHRVQVAEGGAQALEMIESNAFDLVLLDIMMPGIDGFEVLEKIRGATGPSELPVIMATAKTESEDIVAALKRGANDYVTKPFDFPVVLARVQTQLALKKGRDALAAAHHRMQKDLEAAASIQQTLLPPENPEVAGAKCAWRYVPCDELAGDTLNAVPLSDGITGLFVLDVSGHGVPSSLLSVTLSRLMSGTSDASSVLWTRGDGPGELRVATPVEVARELSRRVPYNQETRQYFTLVYGIFDAREQRFTYVSAGHPPVIHVRRTEEPAIHSSTGPPIALIPAILGPVEYEESTIAVEPGDRLYLFSDGIPEAHESGGEEYGIERIAETLQACFDLDLDESITSLLDRVWEWGGGTGPGDDVSILAVEIGAAR